MDGLASLMQQVPQGQPQQAPQAPMPGMNPRLDNAVEVVNNDVENLNLDPRTEYALKVQEASDLLSSAERDLAMKQPQPTPPEVVDQRKQQVQQRIQQGVAGLLQQLMPGMQQRGMQMAAMQAPRGLPTQAAPNMARMMDGGIVGYQEGGEVYDDIGAMAALYKQASDKLYDPAATVQEKANAQQQIDMITAQAGNRIGQVRRRVAEMSGTMDTEMAGGGYIKGYRAGGMPLLERLGVLVEPISDLFSPERYEREPSEEARRRNETPGIMESAIDPRTGEVVRRSELEPTVGAAYIRRPEEIDLSELPQRRKRVPEEIDLSELPQRRERILVEGPDIGEPAPVEGPDIGELAPDIVPPPPPPSPASTELDELSSLMREGILNNLTPVDEATADERAMRAAGYSEEEIAERQRIRERQAELNRQLGEAETRDPRGQRLDRLIAFLQGAGGATSAAQALRGAGIAAGQERRRQEAEDLQFAENRRARELELLGLEQGDIEQDRAIRVQAYEMSQDAINNQRSSFNQALQSATQLYRGKESDELTREELALRERLEGQANTLREEASKLAKLQYEATLGRYNQQDLRGRAEILLNTAQAMAENLKTGLLPNTEEFAQAQASGRAILNEVSSLVGDMLGVDSDAMASLRRAASGAGEVDTTDFSPEGLEAFNRNR
jgi:hypothetical protein